MRILQIGHLDKIGNRFNGFDLSLYFRKQGHSAENCVWIKNSADTGTWQLSPFSQRKRLDRIISRFEQRLSLQSLLYPFSYKLLLDRRFHAADITHYHLIHNEFFNLTTLPFLTALKPAVWTLHDPWAVTGHCVSPFDCTRWQTGCGHCPNLKVHVPMERDNTALMWKIKKAVYKRCDFDIVVASKFMKDIVSRSPLLSKFRLHHIPFGVDLETFRPTDSEAARRKLGVKPGHVAIGFRAIDGDFKGLPYILECFKKLNPSKPVCLITFHVEGLVQELKSKYQVIELGCVSDNEAMVNAYNAVDFFLMPSLADTFGLMAIEAMACGRPVITFEGTALPGTIFAPDGGISVPKGDAAALCAAAESLIGDDDKRKKLGERALSLARQHYDFRLYAGRTLELYSEILARNNTRR